MIGLFPGALLSAGRIVVVAGVCTLVGTPVVLAQQASSEQATDAEAALVERIKREVMKDLMREGALDAQINAGIKRYIAKQRAAQAAAGARKKQRGDRPTGGNVARTPNPEPRAPAGVTLALQEA